MRKELDWDALDAAIRAGDAARDAIADYYDSLTSAEVEEEFDGEPVQVRRVPRHRQGVVYAIRFSRDEILRVRMAAGDQGTVEWMRSAVLQRARVHWATRKYRAALNRLADD